MSAPEAYPKGRLIAHAGGAIDGVKYSNTVEAFDRSSSRVGLVEMDICRAADGLIVAHDGTENRYGLRSRFRDTTVSEFRRTRFAQKYSVMTAEDLIRKLASVRAGVVLDIKSEGPGEYGEHVREIARLCSPGGLTERVIVQAYGEEDFDEARGAGFDNIVLALWKSFGNVRTPQCQACIDYCIRNKPTGFFALSIAARHFLREGEYVGDELTPYNFARAGMIFLHGQPPEAEAILLNSGHGLFSHNAVEWAEQLGASADDVSRNEDFS